MWFVRPRHGLKSAKTPIYDVFESRWILAEKKGFVNKNEWITFCQERKKFGLS